MEYEIGPITREEALKIDAKYVAYVERGLDSDAFNHVYDAWQKLKKGQLVLTVSRANRKEFIIAKVTMVNRNTYQAVDGPVVRVRDNEYTWRVDGDGFCVPVKAVK